FVSASIAHTGDTLLASTRASKPARVVLPLPPLPAKAIFMWPIPFNSRVVQDAGGCSRPGFPFVDNRNPDHCIRRAQAESCRRTHRRNACPPRARRLTSGENAPTLQAARRRVRLTPSLPIVAKGIRRGWLPDRPNAPMPRGTHQEPIALRAAKT